jgi:hypothetical protein
MEILTLFLVISSRISTHSKVVPEDNTSFRSSISFWHDDFV